jgi:flavin-dependent dehydrogenase
VSGIRILGAGPAGSSAAIASRLEGRDVLLIEKSRFPRHKVCGEFLSPEIAPTLDALGVWSDVVAAHPAIVRRLALHFRTREKRCPLPEPAYGLSRYRFDDLLLERARLLGATITGASIASEEPGSECGSAIIAHGRKSVSSRGGRLFGFKAHFTGPIDDAIELFFFSGCYVGITPVEDGVTNVCGLGPEDFLRARDFDIDAVTHASPKLAERLRPLTRTMKWLTAGPLVFRNHLHDAPRDNEYLAGDALSFVDPFTGSGLLSAVVTGRLAGLAAARGESPADYLAKCRETLESPFRISSFFRTLVSRGWAEWLVGLAPGSWLVHATRPRAFGNHLERRASNS